MNKKLNFITVCTDRYPMIYAEKITRQFLNKTNLEVDCYCLTDRPEEVGGWATPLKLPIKSDGWWNKVNLFSPGMPEGWLLYMDLDIVIRSNFDEEIKWVLAQNKKVACVSDAIRWMGVKFSSSFMIIKSGSQSNVFKAFKHAQNTIEGRAGGDQVWMGPLLKKVLYVDEHFPNLKKNLKFHIASKEGDRLILPDVIDDTIKLVDCTGDPKPHELGALKYIKENWHDVEVSS